MAAYNDLLNQLFGGGLLGADVPREYSDQAQKQAALQAGLSMLANSSRQVGPRRGLGEIAAQGVLAGQQGYGQAINNQFASQEFRNKAEEAKAERALRQEVSGMKLETPEDFVAVGQKLASAGKWDQAQKYFDIAEKRSRQTEGFTLTPGSVRYGPNGEVVAQVPASEGRGADPYYQAIPTPDGYMRFNARSGQMEPISVGGMTPKPIAADPGLKYTMEAAGAEGRTTGETRASKGPASQSFGVAINNMRDTIGKVSTGGPLGVVGLTSQVSDYQGVRQFNNRKEQLSTELRAMFRIPGEGTLSDREQAQYGLQLPDIRNDQAVNNQILKDIEARIAARMGKPTGAIPSAPVSDADALRRALEKYR